MCQDAGIERIVKTVIVDPNASCGLWVTEAGQQALVEVRAPACADGVHCGESQESTEGTRCELVWPLGAPRQLAGFGRLRADVERALQDAINYMTDDQLTVLQQISEVLLGW